MKPKEPSAEPLKRTLRAVIESLKNLDSELLAYQMTLEAARTAHPSFTAFLEISVAAAKQSETYKKVLRERYDASLAEILDQVEGEESFVAALRAFQENRSKPIN